MLYTSENRRFYKSSDELLILANKDTQNITLFFVFIEDYNHWDTNREEVTFCQLD